MNPEQASFSIIEGLPRIERYFPECFPSAIEAVSKFLFATGDFGNIYGRHTFVYRKPPGPIGFRGNQAELDLDFSCHPFLPEEFCRKIEDLHGVRVSQLDFRNPAEFCGFCESSIDAKVPVICDFSLGFIKGRREYARIYTPHIAVLYGREIRSSRFLALEQMLGATTIEPLDFTGNFEYFRSTFGKLSAYALEPAKQPRRDLLPAEILSQVEDNLHNLHSEDGGLGLLALRRLRTDLEGFLRDPAFRGRSFSVPGAWVFSHERHILRKWLKAAFELPPAQSYSFFSAEFDSLLARLFSGWHAFDFLMEKSLITGNPKALERLPQCLDTLIDEESQAARHWEKLHLILSKA